MNTDAELKTENSEANYLYCLTRSDSLRTARGTDLDGKKTLFLQEFHGIAAVLSKIRLDEFCGPSAEERMKDLSWVGPRACRHDEVVVETMKSSAVLPARFGTIISSMENLENLLRLNRDEVLRFLDRVTDKAEWSVKGLINSKRAKDELVSQILERESKKLAELPPGKRYFLEKRIKNQIDKELKVRMKDVGEKLADDLGRYADEFCDRKVLSRDITELDDDMFLNWALLVPNSASDGILDLIERANEEHKKGGLSFQLTGPWPPYSFCPSFELEESK